MGTAEGTGRNVRLACGYAAQGQNTAGQGLRWNIRVERNSSWSLASRLNAAADGAWLSGAWLRYSSFTRPPVCQSFGSWQKLIPGAPNFRLKPHLVPLLVLPFVKVLAPGKNSYRGLQTSVSSPI